MKRIVMLIMAERGLNMDETEKKICALEEKVEELLSTNKICIESIKELSQVINKIQENLINVSNITLDAYDRARNMPYEIFDLRVQEKYRIPQIMSVDETFYEIVNNHKSIARLGDGEFSIMDNIPRWRFQSTNSKLAERLKEVMSSNEDNLLIGLNDFYGNLDFKNSMKIAVGTRSYITPEIRKMHMKYIDLNRKYANALISRTVDFDNVRKQKQIWNDRDCLFIEGNKTRMGVGNDLFDNVRSIKRILCPAENAFDRYDEILNEAKKISKDILVLIALGATATVLAYDLAKCGYQAIDIGHADLSYEWLLHGGDGTHTEVKYKYNNEHPNGYIVEDIHDEVYDSQIIASIY